MPVLSKPKLPIVALGVSAAGGGTSTAVASADAINHPFYGEYMSDHASAIHVLDEAIAAFGDNSTLLEQRVNALFQVQDDAGALKSLAIVAV